MLLLVAEATELVPVVPASGGLIDVVAATEVDVRLVHDIVLMLETGGAVI